MKQGQLYQYSRHWLNIRPVYGFGQWVLENLPLFVGDGIVWGVTEIAYRSSPNQRASMESNVRHVLRRLRPGLDGPALERETVSTTHDIFQNRGRFFADLSLMAGKRSLDGVFKFELEGHWKALRKTLDGGRGAVLVSAHLGNWYGGGYAVSRMGIPVSSVMYRNMGSSFMDDAVARRAGMSQTFVDGDPMAMMELIRDVRRGRVLAMMCDKPWDARWIEVPFFGRPSRFALGPVRFARMAGVPIFPAFCAWTEPRRYEAVLCEPIEVVGSDPETAEREALARLAAVTETFVGRYLPVWFNFTPAWSEA